MCTKINLLLLNYYFFYHKPFLLFYLLDRSSQKPMTSPMKSFNHCNDLQHLPEVTTYFPSFLSQHTVYHILFAKHHESPSILWSTPVPSQQNIPRSFFFSLKHRSSICFGNANKSSRCHFKVWSSFLLQHFQTLKILYKSLSLLPDFLQ